MKRRQTCGAILCAALLMTALPGTNQMARAGGQEGPIEEILMVSSQEDPSLREVFRVCSEEGEKSEKIEEEALEKLKETADTAVLVIGRIPQEETASEKTVDVPAISEDEQQVVEEPLAVEEEVALPAEENIQTVSSGQQTEDVTISESQQQMISQIAAEFENVVVLFNNFRPYGLEILDEYPSIKSITLIETRDERQVRKAARQLVSLVQPRENNQEETLEKEPEETGQAQELQTEPEPMSEEPETVVSTESESVVEESQTESKQKESDQKKQADGLTGDVNGDGRVDSQDASALMGLVGEDVDQSLFPYADVTGDGSINKKDVKELLRYITGEITGFEAEEK